MAKAYSQDFRQKVIAAIEIDGRKKGEVSEIFSISRNTINLWLKRKEETGAMLPRSNKPLTNRNRITDWQKFRAFATENSSKTQAQMAELWEEEISSRTISRALAYIGFTRKSGQTPRRRQAQGNADQDKRPMGTAKGMKASVKYF